MEKQIENCSYLYNGTILVGIRLPFGVNVIKDEEKGIIIEFAKRQFKRTVQLQLREEKKSVINFGLTREEANILKLAIEECLKI